MVWMKGCVEKATNELGDISAVADEISRRRNRNTNEIYENRHYMPMENRLYILCGTVFGFGVIVAAYRDFHRRH